MNQAHSAALLKKFDDHLLLNQELDYTPINKRQTNIIKNYRSSLGNVQADTEEKRKRLEMVKKTEERIAQLGAQKSEMSDAFFKDAKVVTCQKVLINHGHIMAIPFKPDRGHSQSYSHMDDIAGAESHRRKGVEYKKSLTQ